MIGQKAQYSDILTQPRSVVPEIDLLSWNEFPFLKYISGGTPDRPTLNNLSAPCNQVKYEWIEKQDPLIQSTITAAIADGVVTTITVPAAFAAEINEGTVLQVDSELLWVSSATGTSPLTVTRGYGGSTAVSHLINAPIYLAGRAHREVAAAPTARQILPTMPFNYVQQFVDTIMLSEIEQRTQRYGVTKAVEMETADRTRQLMVAMSAAIFRGGRVIGSNGVAASAGNIKTFIPAGNQVAAGAAQLTNAMVMQAMQACYDQGGPATTPDTIVCNSFNRRRLSLQFGTVNLNTWRAQQERAGGVKVDVLITDFGDIDVLLDPFCPANEVYLLKRDKIGIGPMNGEPLKRTMLAKTGPQDSWMIHGAYTWEVRKSTSHAVITNTAIV